MFKNKEYIYEVYKQGSFTRAAEALYISQPALSNIVKRTEKNIGILLFDRSSNPVTLTEYGKHYIDFVERILLIENDAKKFFNQVNQFKNNISIACASYFCTFELPDIIYLFQEIYPKINVQLIETNSEDTKNSLYANLVNLAISVDKFDSNIYNSIIWKEETIILAVPKNYKINNKLKDYRIKFEEISSGTYNVDNYKKVDIKYFSEEPFLLLKKGNDIYERAIKIANKAGFNPKVNMIFDQLSTSYEAANLGYGIVFIRENLVNNDNPKNNLYYYLIDDELAKRKIYIHYKKDKNLTADMRFFIDFLVDFDKGSMIV